MQQNYHQKHVPHVVRGLALQLPPGISNVYYFDRNGNVSTSRFRGAPSVPKGATPKQYSLFEMRPRFPMVGGWNYSFTLGWDSPLQDSASYDSKDGKYTVAVPLTTLYPDTAIDEAEVRIVLPEGAM
jgi:oligosaccharyltransferase complex subunit alpha (ribophorin I)